MKNGILTFLFFLISLISMGQTSVYIRGTGNNFSASRLVKLNGQSINIPASGRGLCLTIINATTHEHVSSVRYDTYGNAAASNDLAEALNNLQRGQIGILTSFDAWELNVTTNLQNAARRLGLYKLGGGLSTGSRRPYAAIFRGSGVSMGNVEPNHIAYEVMQSNNGNAERAVIATWLIDDAFVGNNLSNALVYGNGAVSGAALIVNHLGNIGIGTNSPNNKLEVNGTIRAKEVKLEATNWPDYVFEKDYKLMPLEAVKSFIDQKGHLPGLKSAKEYEEEGVNMLELNQKLLEKVEEVTLYLIQQQKLIESQAELIKRQQIELDRFSEKSCKPD
ncbi:interleukin-like EMT inducer domain-containing protein [Belliella kenyensis]|uniref:Interleukin-like EMT inducer domain-containing protein n=1 Tax=Belliella kenyensis TaxID=1472724 RepID=A0ABV8EMU0_9BACT|nr:interleukin-like EMT inducer domain-containing protein [Belliella kenyensis]MCH7403553.1 hypothetical protein [Belliella kenyensis]MDN3604925.1 interleukin-like EMT inducer domain-containing protein [Belliella kenyensis]